MKRIISQNIDELNSKVFEEFRSVLENFKEKKTIIIWLSWWTSLLKLFEIFKNNTDKISSEIFSKLKFVFVDERIVPLDDEDSNYKLVYTNLFKDLIEKNLISESQIIKLNYNSPNYLQEYNSQVPHIDIAFLWVWPDWHTCSLFPNHIWLQDETLWYIKITDSPKPPANRITITKNFLKSIPYVFVYICGESKKEAFLNFLNPEIQATNCPAKFTLSCGNYYLVSDMI